MIFSKQLRRSSAGMLYAAGAFLAIGAGTVWLLRATNPKIHFDQEEKVLEGATENQHLVASFKISNRGRSRLILTEVSANSSCCSSVLRAPREVDPGCSGDIFLQIDGTKYGRRTASFTVQTNDPARPKATLHVTAVPALKPPFFVFDPNSIHWRPIRNVNASREYSLQTVERPDDTQWIVSVTSDAPFVVIEQIEEPVIKRQGTDYVVRFYRYRLLLKELPPTGTHSANLVVKKSDGAEDLIPMLLEVEPAAILIPSTVILGVRDDSLVEVVNRDVNSPIVVDLLEAVPEWLSLERQPKPDSSREQFRICRIDGWQSDCPVNASEQGKHAVLRFRVRYSMFGTADTLELHVRQRVDPPSNSVEDL